MSAGDRQLVGVPTTSFRKDFTLYTGAGAGGGGSLTVSGVQRRSYFTDISKFDVYIRTLTQRNQSFQVFSDSGGVNNMPLYFGIAGSNDQPTEQIIAAASVANGLKFTTAPPYDITLNDIGQPYANLNSRIQGQRFLVDGGFFYDQGGYIYPYATAFGSTIGNNSKLVQSFVPQSNKILNVAFSALFFDGSNFDSHDASLRDDLIIEIWDPNKTVIYSETVSKFAPTTVGSVNPAYPYTWTKVDSWTYDTISGLNYFRVLYGYKLSPPSPIAVTPGSTYYICIKQANNHTANTYGAGDNINTSTSLNPSKGQYINGQLYVAFYASTTLVQLGPTNASIGFVTTRDVGRFCLTACWDSPAYYWYDPASNTDQIKITRIDSDRRI